jgi:hypothetical protein
MTMEMVNCPNCFRAFTRRTDQRWKRLCLSCWQANKAQEQSKVEELEQRCAQLERQLQTCKFASLPKPVLRFLLKVAHPDRHQNSQEATQAMQWLLSMREVANQ